MFQERVATKNNVEKIDLSIYKLHDIILSKEKKCR